MCVGYAQAQTKSIQFKSYGVEMHKRSKAYLKTT